MTDIHLILELVITHFTLFHIVTKTFLSQIMKLIYDNCWCFDMFNYSTLLIHQNFRMDLTYMWVLLKLTHLVLNH